MTLTHDEVVDLAPAFVLGALERDEERAVSEHLHSCPDPHDEMGEIGSVVPLLNEAVPQVEPPVALRARIMAAAAEDLAARRAAPPTTIPRTVAAPADVRPAGGRGATVVPIDAVRGRTRPAAIQRWALGLAAVFAIVALGAWNVTLQNDLAGVRDYQSRLTAVLALGQQPGSQVAFLASASGPGGPGGVGVMPASGRGQLVMSGLKPTSGSHVYEVWAIAEGSPPAPVGWFTTNSAGVGYFDDMPPSVGVTITVALTLETQKNPPAPTSPVLASGPAIVNA